VPAFSTKCPNCTGDYGVGQSWLVNTIGVVVVLLLIFATPVGLLALAILWLLKVINEGG
jgi:hypothetical protein